MKRKKMLLKLLVGILLIYSSNGVYYFENEPFLHFIDEQQYVQEVPQRINPENVGVKVTADKYFVLDLASGKVLAEKNAQVPQPLASITKLMTAMVILDLEPQWNTVVQMQKQDETVGARPHIYRGEEVTFTDLWNAALISSDNNSIMAMVRASGVSRSEFVSLMNKKAHDLELFSTTFADPTGLLIENTSTATDVAKLVYFALQYQQIQETAILSDYVLSIENGGKSRKIYATDVLVGSFLNDPQYGYELRGGKTGFLNEAGYCLAVQVTNDGHDVLVVVLNSETINDRFHDTKVLTDWVFENYEW